ncbi:MAG: hypothetical protein WAU54_17460 [Chania sp.]
METIGKIRRRAHVFIRHESNMGQGKATEGKSEWHTQKRDKGKTKYLSKVWGLYMAVRSGLIRCAPPSGGLRPSKMAGHFVEPCRGFSPLSFGEYKSKKA